MSQVRPSIAPKSDLELKVRASKGIQKNQDFPLNSNCKIGEIKCVHLFLTNKTFELFGVC
jgi:hypothetical protein